MAPRKSKNQLRREKAKAAKLAAKEAPTEKPPKSPQNNDSKPPPPTTPFLMDFEIESNEAFAEYQKIFDKFEATNFNSETQTAPDTNNEDNVMYSDGEDEYEDADDEYYYENQQQPRRSKKREKIPLAELKASTSKPDMVEWHDADALEPFLVVHLKSWPNVVPVPAHWTQKREYLSQKRGFSSSRYELPQFIKDTGIMDMRDTTGDDESTLKQRARERVQPKMGKMDIDYQKLHDAFFKFQTKPRLYHFGDQYFEGKEFEPDLGKFRPGVISAELREALNMPPNAPPPWLLQMQRFGPPPAYKDLSIPGVNAPIPANAQWGFHPGGYGKPPLDENNKPLYGDVFGEQVVKRAAPVVLDKSLWGQPGEDESSSEEEEEEEEVEMVSDDEEEGQGYVDGDFAQSKEQTYAEQSSSQYKGPTEMEKDEPLDLRKRRHDEVEDDQEKTLYKVLPTKKKAITQMMDTDFVYDMSGGKEKQKDQLQSNIDNLFDSLHKG